MSLLPISVYQLGRPNKTLSDPHTASVQHFAYTFTDDLLGGFPVQADRGPPDLEPIRSAPSSAGWFVEQPQLRQVC